jgi:hypothetical protein
MSQEKSCASCRYWLNEQCRHSPPQVLPDGSSSWPHTLRDDFCGRHSPRTRPKGKRSKASDGAILRLILDEIKYAGAMTRKGLVSDIRMNFNLSRTAALSRVNVLNGQGLIAINGELVTVTRPELADAEEAVT